MHIEFAKAKVEITHGMENGSICIFSDEYYYKDILVEIIKNNISS